MPGLGNRGILWAAVGALLLWAITLAAMRPPSPLARDAPPAAFSAARAFDDLKDLVGSGEPHPMGSAANIRVRNTLVAKLEALGYSVELQTGWACNPRSGCGQPTNIVATRRDIHADGLQQDAVLLAAHYDSVAAGAGASDDGVGVVAALEIARILADAKAAATRHPVVILISDGEEGGLLGAMLFAREHPLSKHIAAAVNMDSRGTSGLSLMFETGAANAWLMHLYARSMERPITNSFYYMIYKLLPSDTDFSVFKAAGYQGFNFAFIGTAGFYHTPLDDLAHASPATIQDQGSNGLQALRALANEPDLKHPAAESVFFDVWGRTLVVWSPTAVPPITLGLLLLAIVAVAALMRRGRTRLREVAWGLLGFIVNLVLGAALSIAALAFLFGVGKAPPFLAGPWIAHPAAMSIGTLAVALFAAATTAHWLKNRAGFWGLWAGAALGIAVLAAVIANLNPGPVFPLLLSTVGALAGAVPALATDAQKPLTRWALECAALLPGFILLGVLLPMLSLLYQGVGVLAWPAISIGAGAALGFWLPLLATSSQQLGKSVMAYSGAIAVAGLAVTLLLPTFSPQSPQRINIEYWLDADTGRAHWWVQPGSLQLPAPMAAEASFDKTLQPRFPGISQMGFAAPAPAIAAEAPHMELISTAGTYFEYRLTSPRQSDKLFAVFPAAAQVNKVTVNTPSGPLTTQLPQLGGGATLLTLRNLPAEGMVIGINSPTPISALVLDESYGLPRELAQGKALQSARPENATSTQDGDVTVLGRTVR
jgi:Peptidase family M28